MHTRGTHWAEMVADEKGLTWNLSEEGGWPCPHPLPSAQENIAFSTSNILFISNVIHLLLNSHLIHTCCIPFVPKCA